MQVTRSAAPWLLLVPQLPSKPDYLRVKLRRRLARIGAMLLKSSVYVLPNTEDALEDFAWLRREIVAADGDALICTASVVDGMSDNVVTELFLREASERYDAIVSDVRSAISEKRMNAGARLRRRLEVAVETDFFGADNRRDAEAAVRSLEDAPAPEHMFDSDSTGLKLMPGRTWVTRTGCKVDRMASAWLIRRFVDPQAQFRFVDPGTYVHADGELRFDMFDGEFTHAGENCTFETLVERFTLTDPGVAVIGAIVHDIDMKDAKFGRVETPGIAALIAGIVLAHADDDVRIEQGYALFDSMYAAFSPRRE